MTSDDTKIEAAMDAVTAAAEAHGMVLVCAIANIRLDGYLQVRSRVAANKPGLSDSQGMSAVMACINEIVNLREKTIGFVAEHTDIQCVTCGGRPVVSLVPPACETCASLMDSQQVRE